MLRSRRRIFQSDSNKKNVQPVTFVWESSLTENDEICTTENGSFQGSYQLRAEEWYFFILRLSELKGTDVNFRQAGRQACILLKRVHGSQTGDCMGFYSN